MKYELTEEIKMVYGYTLHRVKYADGTLGAECAMTKTLATF